MTGLKIAFYMLIISGFNTAIIAEPFQLSLKNQGKVLEVSLGNTKLPLKASEAWNRMQDDTYTFEGDLEIGDAFSMTTVTATVGPDGGAFSTGAGFQLGNLSLTAGDLTFALMPGEDLSELIELPDVIGSLDDEDIAIYTALSSAIEIGIGDNTTISLPTPVDVAAAMLVEFNSGTFFYEGPIPSPTQAADGANSFVKAASSSDGDGSSMLTGSFGFSTERAFSFNSAFEVYQSSNRDPVTEGFGANVVMIGEFELADFVSLEGQLFLQPETGRFGINSAAIIGYEMFGASASMEVGAGSFIVDRDGLRFGFGMNSALDSFSLPRQLDNIAHFALPMLDASASVHGLAKTNTDFLINLEADNISMSGIDGSDASFKLSKSGLEVSSKFSLDGVGKVKVSGEVTNSSCQLTAEKIRIFNLWDIKNASFNPCKAAKDGAYAFEGQIKILGIPAVISGVGDAANSAAAVLDREYKFDQGFSVKKKFGVDGVGIAGGYVKLDASGNIAASLDPTDGSLSSEVDLDGRAKFCGKVNFAGYKEKKCASTKSGIKDGFDVSSGCFNFEASKKILGKTFRIKSGKVCPFPGANEDDSDYQEDDISDDYDELDEDDLGISIALMDVNGQYVTFDEQLILKVSDEPESEKSIFTIINKDGGECPTNGTKIAIRAGDPDFIENGTYWRVKKDKSSALNAQAGDDDANTASKKRFYIYADHMNGNGNCLSDGDIIRFKNKKYGRWVSSVGGTLVAKSNGGYDYQAFTVVFDPFADE